MSKIEIHHPSQKQLSKLRNGHTIIVKKSMIEGQGLNLIIDPSKFQLLSKTFGKGRSMRLQLTPTEIVSSKLPVLTASAQSALSSNAQADSGAPNPKPTVVGNTSPALGMGLSQKVQNMGPRNTIAPNTLHGAIAQNKMFDDMAHHVGRQYGLVQKSRMGTMLSGMDSSHHDQELVAAKQSGQFFGRGLYVGTPLNHNIGARQSGRMPQRMVEGGSLGMNGGFIHEQPALISQPYGANFQFSKTLPVAYQKFSSGTGLYLS